MTSCRLKPFLLRASLLSAMIGYLWRWCVLFHSVDQMPSTHMLARKVRESQILTRTAQESHVLSSQAVGPPSSIISRKVKESNIVSPQRSITNSRAMQHTSENKALTTTTTQLLPRVLAIVFPQFHADPLNDKLWGKGFTDWNNLRSAPQFNRLGYAIPRPTELGYYDYTNTTARKMQGDLAREHGVDGFVFHHYWFYDETHPGPNLHAPLMKMLQDGQPDMPFLFHWCASKWVDTWLGHSQNHSTSRGFNTLQEQNFPNVTDPAVAAHYKWLSQFFHHRNYIKIHGQPVLMVYNKKPKSFPILQQFREWAKQDGFPGLYVTIGMAKTHDGLFPAGKDVGQRFNRFPKQTVNRTVAYPFPLEIMSKQVLQIPDWCKHRPVPKNQPKNNFQIPGILIAFDNTPRRSLESANLWSGDEPDMVVSRFSQSIHAAIHYETCCVPVKQKEVQHSDKSDGDERIILINSMNEWAEGMALEPSDVFGKRFLEAIRDAKVKVAATGCGQPVAPA